MAQLFHARQPFIPHLIVECYLAALADRAAGGVQDRFGGAFNCEEELIALNMHGRHHLGIGVECVLASNRAAPRQRRLVEPGPQTCAQQCKLHGIAAAFLLIVAEGCIVAKHGDLEQQASLGILA